jgi:hypothetical protein
MSDMEIVTVRGVLIDLKKVSPALRQQYRVASRAVGRIEQAQAELDRIGQEILAEQAFKVAPKLQGNHAVAARLMGKR